MEAATFSSSTTSIWNARISLMRKLAPFSWKYFWISSAEAVICGRNLAGSTVAYSILAISFFNLVGALDFVAGNHHAFRHQVLHLGEQHLAGDVFFELGDGEVHLRQIRRVDFAPDELAVLVQHGRERTNGAGHVGFRNRQAQALGLVDHRRAVISSSIIWGT